MSYRRSFGRFSKRSWEDFNDEVHRAKNEHLMDGIVAGCALVAYADGWVTEEERVRMLGLIRGFEPIAAFGLDDVASTFALMSTQFASDQKAGEQAALDAVAKLKGAGRYPELLVEVCCSIAAADGGFDAEERLAAIRICETLGLEPAEFDLEEAP
jgi:tellurite resistance protein TerB